MSIHGLLLGILLLVGIWLFKTTERYLDEKQIIEKRKGWKFEDFVRELHGNGLCPSEKACEIVYYGLAVTRTLTPQFPVRSDDILEIIYEIGGACRVSIDEAVDDILFLFDIEMPMRKISDLDDQFGDVFTAKDLVLLVDKLLSNI